MIGRVGSFFLCGNLVNAVVYLFRFGCTINLGHVPSRTQEVRKRNVNEFNEGNLPDRRDEQHIAPALLDKHQEKVEYKRLLFILAMSVIGVTVVVQFAIMIAHLALSAITARLDLNTLEQFTLILESAGARNVDDTAYMLFWLLNDIVVYLPPILFFGLIFRKRMGFRKIGEPYNYKYYWIVPLFFMAAMLTSVASIVTGLIAQIFIGGGNGEGLPEVFSGVLPTTNTQLLTMLVTAGVVAPVCEEIIYRHLLLRPLRRYGDLQAVIITSLLFGFFHGNLTQFLYTAVVGMLLGLVAVKANSVLPAIVIHAMNNIFVVLQMRVFELAEAGLIPLEVEGVSAISLVVFVTGVASLIVMVRKRSLHVENHNPHLSSGERVRMLVFRPSIIFMVLFLTFITVMGTLVMMM